MLSLPTRKHSFPSAKHGLGPKRQCTTVLVPVAVSLRMLYLWAAENTTQNSLSSIPQQRRTPEARRLLGWVVKRFSGLSKIPVHTLRSIVLASTQGWFPPSCRVIVISNQERILFCSHPVEKESWLPVIFLLKPKKCFSPKRP